MNEHLTLSDKLFGLLLKVKCLISKSKSKFKNFDEEDLIDEASDESFPASDPPGYRSKTHRDRELHKTNHKH